MIPEFSQLTQEEKNLLYDVPALATILIAGADNIIDKYEKQVAAELTKYKSVTSEPELQDYFAHVSTTFRERLEQLIAELPGKAKFRNPFIREQLAHVNEITVKINEEFSMEYYKHIKDIARYVAEASGGVLGYLSINKAEARALNNLDMILNPKKLKGKE